MPEDLLDSLTYSMQEKTKRIIELKNGYRYYKVIDFNIIVVLVLLTASICSIALKMYLSYNSFDSYAVPSIIAFGCSGYYYIYYNSRVTKKIKLIEDYDILRKDMISCIDNQFQFEFCNHNKKCKCKDKYIKYMKDKYDIDLIFR